MSDKISFQDFRFNTLSMLNMLQAAEYNHAAGPERDAAYAKVGVDLGLGTDAFSNLV